MRIDALGLLCESHRSTEIISMEVMQLIQFFIKYNLNSQSPATRQQVCSLLKKVTSKWYIRATALDVLFVLNLKAVQVEFKCARLFFFFFIKPWFSINRKGLLLLWVDLLICMQVWEGWWGRQGRVYQSRLNYACVCSFWALSQLVKTWNNLCRYCVQQF